MAEKLQFIIDAKDKTNAAFKKVQGNVDKTQGKLAKMRPMLDKIAKGFALVGAAAVVAFGVKSVKAASDFSKGMANIATIVDVNTESMEDMGKQVRELSKRVPKDINELTEALLTTDPHMEGWVLFGYDTRNIPYNLSHLFGRAKNYFSSNHKDQSKSPLGKQSKPESPLEQI